MGPIGKAVSAVVITPIVILIVGIGGCEARKAYYDWRVRTLCETDGGATVYEQVTLNPEMFRKMKGVGDAVLVPDESARKTDIPVYRRWEQQMIREGHPSIHRVEMKIVRRVDSKVLGTAVRFSRRGGDFPFTVSNPSHFGCPDLDLASKLFVVEGEGK